MATMDLHTLTDCGCKAKVYSDGSGVDIEYCSLHWAAPDLLRAAQGALNILENVTTEDFSLGKDKEARELLAAAITKATGVQND